MADTDYPRISKISTPHNSFLAIVEPPPSQLFCRFDRPSNSSCAGTRWRDTHGPSGPGRRHYLAHRAGQQMSPRTLQGIAIYTLVVAKALRLADRPGELVTRTEIEAEADRWVSRHPRPPAMREATVRGSGSPAMPLDGSLSSGVCNLQPRLQGGRHHVHQFPHDMLRQRGLSPLTVEYRCRQISRVPDADRRSRPAARCSDRRPGG